MSAGSNAFPPSQPPPVGKEWRILLFVLVGVALAGALTIVALVFLLRPPSPSAGAPGTAPVPAPVNPDAPIVATDLFIGADDFVVDVFHNGHRVPDEARKMNSEVYGAIG